MISDLAASLESGGRRGAFGREGATDYGVRLLDQWLRRFETAQA